jgi:hypothetical protein
MTVSFEVRGCVPLAGGVRSVVLTGVSPPGLRDPIELAGLGAPVLALGLTASTGWAKQNRTPLRTPAPRWWVPEAQGRHSAGAEPS